MFKGLDYKELAGLTNKEMVLEAIKYFKKHCPDSQFAPSTILFILNTCLNFKTRRDVLSYNLRWLVNHGKIRKASPVNSYDFIRH